jgi:branched-chain amino acid transport system permease protein
MAYFIEVTLNGVLAGAIYALIGLAFVVVYKASRVINFALGEFLMIAVRLVATGLYVLGLGLTGALAFGCAGMVLLAVGFNWLILRNLVGSRVVTLIMVTIGFGVVLRALVAYVFAGIPGALPLPISQEPIIIHGVLISPDELVAVVLATACVVAVSWFFHRSRTGVALRAMADDAQAAMLVGIDMNRHITLTWGLAGLIAVLAGTLGTFTTGGGFSMILVSLKVFPIVMIGGLDSIVGVVIGAMLVGLLENVAAAYLDPLISGFSLIASYLVLIVMLFVRPYGLFGEPDVERV